MGLTDVNTVIVASAVTVVLFVAAVALTPRLTAPVVGWVSRAALILLTSVGLLVSVGLKLNADNGWYVSWSDLRGEAPGAATVEERGGAATAAAGDAGATSAVAKAQAGSPDRPPLPSPGERLQTYEVTGKTSGLKMKVLVYLPRSYGTSPRRFYPVIYAYHGYPGTPSGWTGTMGVGAAIDRAVDAHTIAESIIVVPQINSPVGRDGECENGPAGTPQLETWLADDVPAFARTHLRTVEDRSARAAMGYSAGAFCSAVVTVLHPDMFGAGVVLSGYFRPDFADGTPVLQPGSAAAGRYDLVAALGRSMPRVALWIQAGEKSPYWAQTQQFIQAAKAPMSVTAQVEPDAGHRWDAWKARLPTAFAWLGKNVPGFQP